MGEPIHRETAARPDVLDAVRRALDTFEHMSSSGASVDARYHLIHGVHMVVRDWLSCECGAAEAVTRIEAHLQDADGQMAQRSPDMHRVPAGQ